MVRLTRNVLLDILSVPPWSLRCHPWSRSGSSPFETRFMQMVGSTFPVVMQNRNVNMTEKENINPGGILGQCAQLSGHRLPPPLCPAHRSCASPTQMRDRRQSD